MKLVCLILTVQFLTCYAMEKTQVLISGPGGKTFKQVMLTNDKDSKHINLPDQRDIFEINRDTEGLIHGDILPSKRQQENQLPVEASVKEAAVDNSKTGNKDTRR